MSIAQLFLNIAVHQGLPLEFGENLEALYSLDFEDSGLTIRNILNKRYPDGITGLESVETTDNTITGVFLDQISPTVTKKFNFVINAVTGEVSYDQIDTGDLDFSEEVDFAVKKSQTCKEGKSAGCTREDGSVYCIPLGRKCKTGKRLDDKETKAVKEVIAKAAKGGKVKTTKTPKPKVVKQPKPVKEKVVKEFKPKKEKSIKENVTKVAKPDEIRSENSKVAPKKEDTGLLKLPNVDSELIKSYQKEIESDPFFGDTAKYLRISATNRLRTDKGLKSTKISPTELAMITHYTDATSGDYSLINSFLRGNVPKVDIILKGRLENGDTREPEFFKERVKKQAALLNSALDKLPVYTGEVVRKSPLSQATIDQYQVGKTIQEKGFTSTTTSGDYGINVPSDRVEVVFKIKSKTGREISPYSAFPDEEEVLFKSGTQFKVVKKESKGGKVFIRMEEV